MRYVLGFIRYILPILIVMGTVYYAFYLMLSWRYARFNIFG